MVGCSVPTGTITGFLRPSSAASIWPPEEPYTLYVRTVGYVGGVDMGVGVGVGSGVVWVWVCVCVCVWENVCVCMYRAVPCAAYTHLAAGRTTTCSTRGPY